MGVLKNIFNGILIGIANVIPGLSGATIALLLGVYEKLIHTLSKLDKKLFQEIYKLNFLAVYKYLSLNFLIPILIGIILGVLLFAKSLELFDLLGEQKDLTLSYFFGLVLASVPFILKMIPKWKYFSITFTGILIDVIS